MRHILFGTDKCQASIAILTKDAYLNKGEILRHYIKPLKADEKAFIAFGLWYSELNKCPAKYAKEYLKELLAELAFLEIKTLVVTDAAYFKFITRKKKAEVHAGYILDSEFEGFENKFKVIFIPNYRMLDYNPGIKVLIAAGITTLRQFTKNKYQEPGFGIIHSAQYPKTWKEIETAIGALLKEPVLAIDIETRGLQFWNCGIATISFAKDKHNFVAIPVERGTHPGPTKMLLKTFFEKYKGKARWHSANFDLKVLVYELWMKDLQDYSGMIAGIEMLTKNFDDTKVIAYLATNNAVKNALSLKELAAQFAGNYAQDEIEDTTKIELPDLLKYNGTDTLCTNYVFDKFFPKVIEDGQLKIYEEVFKPSIITLLQTELVGLPIFPEKVSIARHKLKTISNDAYTALTSMSAIKAFIIDLKKATASRLTKRAKKKIYKLSDPLVQRVEFNPNSPYQLRKLFYEFMGMQIVDTTATGLPATDNKAIKKFINKTRNKEYLKILDNLFKFSTTNKILTTFIPAFENAVVQPDGSYRLYGNFNVGATVSGRLSSCVIGDTKVQCTDGLKLITAVTCDDTVPTHLGNTCKVKNVFDNGFQEVYEITLESGEKLTCTSNHRLLTTDGFKSLEDMNEESMDRRCRTAQTDSTISNAIPKRITDRTNGYDSCEKWQGNDERKKIIRCGRIKKKESLRKKTKNHRARKSCTSKGYKDVPRMHRNIYRRSSKKSKYTPSNFVPIFKNHFRGYGSGKIVQTEKVIPQNYGQNQSSGFPFFRGNTGRTRVCAGSYAAMVKKKTKVYLRASGSDAEASWNRRVAKRFCSASYKSRQDGQQANKFSSTIRNSSYVLTSGSSSRITKIDYVGIRRVYDLEIEKDHCYLANGVYVHNSNPNLTNLPSKSEWGKIVKKCFGCEQGWIFGGADFHSLEAMVDALLTRDPNKLAVYIDGMDSHAFNTLTYWPKKMPDIVNALEEGKRTKQCYKVTHTDKSTTYEVAENLPKNIRGLEKTTFKKYKAYHVNRIMTEYSDTRSKSKQCTFALQYQGTANTLVNRGGFAPNDAKAIVANYHRAYTVARKWTADRLLEARRDGFVTCAFGLRLRTPLLHKKPARAMLHGVTAKENRTAGNALSQSYGLLNLRAANEFRERVWKSQYRNDIMLCCQIHDAVYLFWKDKLGIAKWINDNLITCMEWCELKELQHPTVKLGADLEIFYPDWNSPIAIPNKASLREIKRICYTATERKI